VKITPERKANYSSPILPFLPQPLKAVDKRIEELSVFVTSELEAFSYAL